MIRARLRIGLAMFALRLACGQSADKALTFDVASVKAATLPTANGRGFIMLSPPTGGPGTKDPGRVHYPYSTLKNLLMIAYEVKDFQIAGPSWMDSDRFDITATMPPDTTMAQFHVMLQNLLTERFKMTVHRESKELPMYSLVVAKGGPKMKESAEAPPKDDGEPAPLPPPPSQPKIGPDGFPIIPMPAGRGGIFGIMMNGRSRLIAQRQTMKDLANRLTNQLSRPVTDATGLTANYDFTLTFSSEGMNGPMGPMGPPPPPPGGGAVGAGGVPGPASPPEAEALPDIFGAVQAQLGLRLEAKKGPVAIVVIDRVEKTPTEN